MEITMLYFTSILCGTQMGQVDECKLLITPGENERPIVASIYKCIKDAEGSWDVVEKF